MTIKGMMLRFFLVYPLLLIAAGILMKYIIGYGINTGLSFGILFGCIMWFCISFRKKNGRYFSDKEKYTVIAGFFAIDLLFQLLFGLAAFAKLPSNSMTALFIGIGILSFVRLIVIYAIVEITNKLLVKQKVIAG
jgi:hypothetical protein